MPKVLISYDPQHGEYNITDAWEKTPGEYDAVVDMKSSHFRNIQRNLARVMKDQDFLESFFVEAQMAGREIRER